MMMPEIYQTSPLRIRAIQKTDFNQVKIIHERYYKNEFVLPDFVTHFKSAFVVEDDIGIISVCGLREIAEAVAITDKSRSVLIRKEALLQQLDGLAVVADIANYHEIHAFVQDDIWEHRLRRVGFRPTKGKALVLLI